ncbi:MAG TPA: hypothetical protein VE890_00595 [Thermoguttaceae bacterium]|nr:hypothetical protein [Thermoguttaceae bacterium]
MPAKYEKLGISFQYPDNWKLDEEDAMAGCDSVTVYSPGGSFWSLAIHPRSADPRLLAEGVVDTMKQEYDEIEAEEVSESVSDHELIGYDLNFYCLDLTNTAKIRCLRADQHTLTVFCQADDREFERIKSVFQAMTVSLLSSVEKIRWGRDIG